MPTISLGLDSLSHRKPTGLLDTMGGLVATPEQEALSRELAARFGIADATVEDSPQQAVSGLLGEAPERPCPAWRRQRECSRWTAGQPKQSN